MCELSHIGAFLSKKSGNPPSADRLRGEFGFSILRGLSTDGLSAQIKNDFVPGLGICGAPAPVDPTYT